MRRLAVLCSIFSTVCFAQARHRLVQGPVEGKNVAPHASIQVCVAGTGCKTAAVVYADASLTSRLSLPLTADDKGHYSYYLVSGCVDEQITSPGRDPFLLAHVCPAAEQQGEDEKTAASGAAMPNANSSADADAMPLAISSAAGQEGMNSDSFASGGGSGVARAQASPHCTGNNCLIVTPPSSTDASRFGALPELAGRPSSLWVDYRNGQFGIAATNPPPNTMTDHKFQAKMTGSVAYTEPNPGTIQGAEQLAHYEQNFFLTPGYSNGQVGCPDFCPAKGYIQDPNGNLEGATTWGTTGATQPRFSAAVGGKTPDGSVVWTNYGPGTTPGRWSADTVIAASHWTVNLYRDVVNNFNSASIKGQGALTNRCYGVGDCQAGGYSYPILEGGFSSPSDEGAYAGPAFLAQTSPDWQGTLATVADENHIVARPTAYNGTQGDGRFLIDISAAIAGTDGQPLSGMVDQVTHPSSTTYGTVVMNSAQMPVSYAQGKLAKDCVVPIQNGTVAQTTCSISVTSGRFDTAAPVCMANTSGNTYAFGAQPILVTAASGGVQTITTKINKSVAAGGFVFQGGLCGAMVTLASDINTSGGGTVYGSTFMILGSTDAHTAVYASYFASQIWASIPAWGSQFRSKQQSAVSLADLTRTDNVVTARIASGLGGTPPSADLLNGARDFTIAGCAETTMNGKGDLGQISLLPNDTAQVSYRQAGANATCSKATFYPTTSNATFYWGSEVYDVVDHTPGLSPKDGVLNGHFLTSYQPHFAVGHKLDMPPHYSLSVEGVHAALMMSEPGQKNNGMTIYASNYSSLGGTGLNIQNHISADMMAGSGGAGVPNIGIYESGAFTCALCLHDAPMHRGAIIKVGGLAPGYKKNPYFGNYDVIALENGAKSLTYDTSSQTLSWRFSNATPNDVLDLTAAGTVNKQTSIMRNAQFEGRDPADNAFDPVTQFAECGREGSFHQPCYDNVVGVPVITNAGAAGSATRAYLIGIKNPNGTVTFTKYGYTHTGNAVLSRSNYNVISCSVVPAGSTGTVYGFYGSKFFQIGATGACTGPGAMVEDIGDAGASLGSTLLSMGADMNVGRLVVNGNGGSLAWTQPDNFGGRTKGDSPLTIVQDISAPSPGVFSFDSNAKGNGQGNLVAQSVTVSHQPLRYVGSLTTTAAASDSLAVTGLTPSHHCIVQQTGNATPLASTISVGAGTVTLYHARAAGDTFDVSCNLP